MTNRLHTVEVEGYGPVTIRALTKAQRERIERQAHGIDDFAMTLVVRRGCVEPNIAGMPDKDFLAEFGDKPLVLRAIGWAILERSWPLVEV